MTTANTEKTNRLLGYPADARLLLVNADDLACVMPSPRPLSARFRMGSSPPAAYGAAPLVAPCAHLAVSGACRARWCAFNRDQ